MSATPHRRSLLVAVLAATGAIATACLAADFPGYEVTIDNRNPDAVLVRLTGDSFVEAAFEGRDPNVTAFVVPANERRALPAVEAALREGRPVPGSLEILAVDCSAVQAVSVDLGKHVVTIVESEVKVRASNGGDDPPAADIDTTCDG